MTILFDLPYLIRNGWQDFLADGRERISCIVKDAGTLESVDEVTKYVTNPNDIETMEDGHLEWFYNETLNTPLIQRYGSFKEIKGSLNDERLRIVRDQSDGSLKMMKKRVINDAELFTKRDDELFTKRDEG
ncbi:hypothetical protein, partial [Gluconobacter sp. P1D12_c]|uniref:hypothetical protein n=1 Tax=Gluconobacter sp. P1D12_c TaxID=2762614 RepID=UPI001C054A2D